MLVSGRLTFLLIFHALYLMLPFSERETRTILNAKTQHILKASISSLLLVFSATMFALM